MEQKFHQVLLLIKAISSTWRLFWLGGRNNYGSHSQMLFNFFFRDSPFPLFERTSFRAARRLIRMKTGQHETMEEDFFWLYGAEVKRTHDETLNRWQGVVIAKIVVLGTPVMWWKFRQYTNRSGSNHRCLYLGTPLTGPSLIKVVLGYIYHSGLHNPLWGVAFPLF